MELGGTLMDVFSQVSAEYWLDFVSEGILLLGGVAAGHRFMFGLGVGILVPAGKVAVGLSVHYILAPLYNTQLNS